MKDADPNKVPCSNDQEQAAFRSTHYYRSGLLLLSAAGLASLAMVMRWTGRRSIRESTAKSISNAVLAGSVGLFGWSIVESSRSDAASEPERFPDQIKGSVDRSLPSSSHKAAAVQDDWKSRVTLVSESTGRGR